MIIRRLLFTNYILIISVLLIFSRPSFTQENTETVMFKAMKDELDRNMKKLVYKDNKGPFYISYTIEDIKTLFVSGILGALSNSSEKHFRNWMNRVLAGDYQLNDENFVDATRRKPSRDGNLEMPLDDDYYGIRRALWMMTNNTYKSAAENYKNKLEALNDKNLGKKDLQIPDFCITPVVKMSIPDPDYKWNKSYLETLVKSVSQTFKNYPDILYSVASAYQIHADLYFYSSEECQIKTPFDLIFFSVSAYCQADDGENMSDELRYFRNSTNGLPMLDSLKEDAKILALNLINKKKSPVLTENYSGPVLFLGQAVAEVFTQGLFSGTDNLFAYREPLYNSSQMSMYYGQNVNSLESKIGKSIMAKNITIKDLSRLKVYNGSELIGAYDADAEGVIPTDTIELIDRGILKNLYNGRTPTRSMGASNGHRRYTVQGGGITSDLGPGVLFINTTDGKSIEELKKDLIKTAKEDDLDYAIIVRPVKQGDFYNPLNFYKVSVSDGKEELLRSASFNPITITSLKKIIAASSTSIVYNTLIKPEPNPEDDEGNVLNSQDAIPTGIPVSYITPNGLLLKEVQFEHQTKPLSTDRPIVKNPLIK